MAQPGESPKDASVERVYSEPSSGEATPDGVLGGASAVEAAVIILSVVAVFFWLVLR